MRSFADLSHLPSIPMGFTRPELVDNVRQSIPYEITRFRNEPVIFRIPNALILKYDQDQLDVAIKGDQKESLSQVLNKVAAFYADNSEHFFMGRNFSMDKIRNALQPPMGDMDGVMVPSPLPSEYETRLSLNAKEAVIRDQYDNVLDSLQLGDSADILVHFDRVLFCKKNVLLKFNAAGVRVKKQVSYNWDLPKAISLEPMDVPLPDATESEDDFFSE